MASLAGRVSAAAGAFFYSHSTRTTAAIAVNQNWPEKCPEKSWTEKTWIHCQFSTVSVPKWALPTPILTWTLDSERAVSGDSASRVGAAALFCNPLKSFRFRLRRSSRDPGIFLMTSGGDVACDDDDDDDDDDDATTAVVEGEPTTAAAVQDYKVREASVTAWSFLLTWTIVSVIAAIAFGGGLHWLDGICTEGQKRVNRLKKQSEPMRYWTSISCSLVVWLSAAFFLLSQVQRWETTAMVNGAVAPGGSFCHSTWPNTGLGCQLPFTTTL